MRNQTTVKAVGQFADSIVSLRKAHGADGHEAYAYMSGYLMAHLSTVIDKLPKAKREAVLAEMNSIALSKMAEAASV